MTALPSVHPTLAMDELALLVKEYGFTVTGLGGSMVTAEQPVVEHPEEKREVVFVRLTSAHTWHAGLWHARLTELEGSAAPVIPTYTRRAIGAMVWLETLSEASAWLRSVA